MDGNYKSDVHQLTVSFYGLTGQISWGSEGTSIFYGLNLGAGFGLGIGGSAEAWDGNVIKFK